jgi:PAS domain S-box-containing protein
MELKDEQIRIRQLLKKNLSGLTIEEVSKKLSLNRTTAAKYLNTMLASGQAELRELGRSKIFSLSRRLPLTHMLSLSSDLILILDQDLCIQEVNEPFLSYFNLTKDALKGKKIECSLLAPHFPKTCLASIEQALKGTEDTFDGQFRIGHKDSFFRMKLIPLVFEGGSRGVGIVSVDITEIKRYQIELEDQVRERTANLARTNDALMTEVEYHKMAETALHENEEVLRSMLDATPVGVALMVNRVFKKVNDSFCRITGYSGEDLTGRCSRFLYPDQEDFEWVFEKLYKPRDGRDVRVVESRFRRKDGEIIDVIISLSPFDPQNPDSGVTATFQDITDRKRAEKALQKAKRQVTLLTSITRHDILNQLNTLRGYFSIMKKQKIDEKLREIIRKEETIADTISDQIVFTRAYQNVGAEPPYWTCVTDTIKTVQKSLDAGTVSVDITTEDLEIYADSLVERVFYNLIENSLRHGGEISEIRIAAFETEDGLIVAYTDNGEGIPGDEKELIFEREYGKNTGLGLFLAREILAITGIRIIENGEPGKGARFEISVPRGLYRFSREKTGTGKYLVEPAHPL